MTINLPRREKAAAKTGPRLEISPLELKAQMENVHGLSALLQNADSWEPFAWKGNDLSAPLRALWVAESRGLLTKRNGNLATDVAISDITADINTYLMSLGRKAVTENAVLNNLRTASLYLNAALGVCITADRRAMTVRLLDEYETIENIQRYFDAINPKLKKLESQLKHAEACGYDVSHQLAAVEETTGVRLLASAG